MTKNSKFNIEGGIYKENGHDHRQAEVCLILLSLLGVFIRERRRRRSLRVKPAPRRLRVGPSLWLGVTAMAVYE